MNYEWVVAFEANFFSDPVPFAVAKRIIASTGDSVVAQRIYGTPRLLLKSGKVITLPAMPDWVEQYKKEKGLV